MITDSRCPPKKNPAANDLPPPRCVLSERHLRLAQACGMLGPSGRGIYPTLVDLTNTAEVGQAGASLRVPLRDVIGAAQMVFQTARLKVASELELAETLIADLTAFDPKPVARNMDLRGGRNADLVFALAVALWWGDGLTWGDKRSGMPEMVSPVADRSVGY